MSSIRRFLLFNLLLIAIIIFCLIIFAHIIISKHDINKQQDQQLKQTADLINTVLDYNPSLDSTKLLTNNYFNHSDYLSSKPNQLHLDNPYQLLIWKKNKLIIQSKDVLLLKPPALGFHNLFINNQRWRLYSYHNHHSIFTITLIEPMTIRAKLNKTIIHNNIIILLLTYPIFALFIWFIINCSLNSLKKLTHMLVKRSANFLDPIIDLSHIPLELHPLIEELNQLFLRLNKAFNRNKQFSADAAHELRTPLAALKTQAQVALKTMTEKERQEGLKKVILGADRCTHIVQQLLALSRLGSENIPFNKEKISLTHIAAEIIAQLVPAALEKNIDVEMNQSQDNIEIDGNETAISILIRNLVDNAIRYTPKDGKVVIDIQQEDHTILKVIDNGPGIPIALHSRIFERFYRVLGSQASGSGLGLAIVKQVVQLHHATINLDHLENSQGLVIKITFPNLENKITN